MTVATKVAVLLGTRVAEPILASVHVRARQQAGHMNASDLIKPLPINLRRGGRPHMGRGCVKTLAANFSAQRPSKALPISREMMRPRPQMDGLAARFCAENHAFGFSRSLGRKRSRRRLVQSLFRRRVAPTATRFRQDLEVLRLHGNSAPKQLIHPHDVN